MTVQCQDCKYFVALVDLGDGFGSAPRCAFARRSSPRSPYALAAVERGTEGSCGPEARNFEPKPPKPPKANDREWLRLMVAAGIILAATAVLAKLLG
ncbi:hypothetical protein [Schlegelella aquatica]|uniref:hypothetical protein n=1 Tax=Caldimonas aquatica TaxID=376175 RepID=UPI00375107E0